MTVDEWIVELRSDCFLGVDEHVEIAAHLERQSSEGARHKAVYDIIVSRSHICGGRDCIGYLVRWDSATQMRCPSCVAIANALSVSGKQS